MAREVVRSHTSDFPSLLLLDFPKSWIPISLFSDRPLSESELNSVDHKIYYE